MVSCSLCFPSRPPRSPSLSFNLLFILLTSQPLSTHEFIHLPLTSSHLFSILILSFFSSTSSSPPSHLLPLLLLLILFFLSSLTPYHLLLFFPSFHLSSGTDRSIVSDVAGTTRDTVDALVVRYTTTLSHT